MKYLLHVLPDSINNEKKLYLGSTKDVRSRTQYFRSRNIPVVEYVAAGRSDAEALEMLMQRDLSLCAAVVFEFETYPLSLQYLKQAHPHILRVSRAINANLPHFIDQYRGRERMLADGVAESDTEPMAELETAISRYNIDLDVAKHSDCVLSISQWETDHYWRQLPSSGNVVTAPYFIADNYKGQLIRTENKKNLFVCFMGTGGVMTPLLYDAGKNTVDLINALPDAAKSEWLFFITGRLRPTDIFGNLGRVISTGRLENPYQLLAESKVVSILSDLGMGFKTKILEAVEAGCWVFVTQSLYDRLPQEVLPACVVVDVSSPESLREALTKCADRSAPEVRANDDLQKIAYASLDEIFLEHFNHDGRPAMVVDKIGQYVVAAPTPSIAAASTPDLPPYLVSKYVRGKEVFGAVIEHVLKQHFGSMRNPVVLDHGVGIGSILRADGKYGCQCVGVDRSSGLLQYCREHVPNALYIGQLGEDGGIHFLENSVHLAYSYSSLMRETRLSAILMTLQEIHRVLKQGCFVLIRVRINRPASFTRGLFSSEIVFNQEHRSFVFRFSSLKSINKQLPSIRIPKIDVIHHDAWQGMPFTESGIKRIVRNCGMDVIEFIHDSDPNGKMVWVLAKKL